MRGAAALRVSAFVVALVAAVALPQLAAGATLGSCSASVAGNGFHTCIVALDHPAQRVTVLAEQNCSGAGTMTVAVYPLYAPGVAQTREQFLANEMTQNLACNGTSTIAQRRVVLGGLTDFKIVLQNADATNTRTLMVEWFAELAPMPAPATVGISGVVPVRGDSTSGAERVHVECSNCGGSIAGPLALTDDDRARLDLSWWGTWTIAGFLLVLMAVPFWRSAWRFWQP